MPSKGPARTLAIAGVWIVVILAIVLTVKFIVFPSQKQAAIDETSASSRYKEEVRFGLDNFSSYATIRSEEMANDLGQSGIRLELVSDNADYTDRLKRIKNGDLDMAAFTLDALILATIELGEAPAVAVAMIDATVGADGIVAWESSVASLDDLNTADAKILGTPLSPSETVSRITKSHFLPNMPDNNWFIEANGAQDVFNRMRQYRGKRVAFALWEPWLSKAVADPGIHVLIDSGNMPDAIVDVIVVRRQFLISNPSATRAVVESYLRSAYSHQSDMPALLMADAKQHADEITLDQAKSIVKGILWKRTIENYAHFGLLPRHEAGGLTHIEDMIANITRVLVDTGAISADNIVYGRENTLYNDSILQAMRENNFHPGDRSTVVQNSGGRATLGDLATGARPDLGSVRGVEQLPPLSEEEWNSLIAVGSLKVEELDFRRGSSDLSGSSKRELRTLATTLENFPRYYLLVIGKSQGEDSESNRTFAQERAQSALNYLTDLGVNPNRLRAIGTVTSDSSSVQFVVGQRSY